MKNLILKIPAFVFLIIFLLPLIFYFLKIINPDDAVSNLLMQIFSTSIAGIWTISVAEYMCHEAKSNKYLIVVYVLCFLEVVFQIAPFFLDEKNLYSIFKILLLVNIIVIGIVMTRIVKKVFYARTTWFLFFEVIVIPVGMLSLTPDIKNWEKGDKT